MQKRARNFKISQLEFLFGLKYCVSLCIFSIFTNKTKFTKNNLIKIFTEIHHAARRETIGNVFGKLHNKIE
jgi:hypothetical protein